MKTKILFLIAALGCANLIVVGQNIWNQKANLPASNRVSSVGFGMATKGYLGMGAPDGNFNPSLKDFWEWDPPTNVWTQKADYGGGPLAAGTGFSIGTKGYAGSGYGNITTFWEWDQPTNTWTQKANYPGTTSPGGFDVSFSIGAKGYMGTGDVMTAEFYEYNPATDTWTRKADFGGGPRWAAVGFSIGTKGYIGTGSGTMGYDKDFWEYDPASDTWTQKADFGGTGRWLASGFSIGNKGYIGCGADMGANPCSDFWQYDQATNTWTQKADYGGGPMRDGVGFSVGNYGYFANGCSDANKMNSNNNFWQWSDSICSVKASLFTDDPTTVCAGYPVHLNAGGGTHFLWSTGATTAAIVVSPTITTSYIVSVDSGVGKCTDSKSITIVVLACNTAVSELHSASGQVVISPNPFDESATVNVTGVPKESMQMKVYDVLGSEVRNVNFAGETITLARENLANGVYFYKVILKDQQIITGKFIINKL